MRQHAAPGSDRARRSFSRPGFRNGRGDADVQGREDKCRRRRAPPGRAPLRREDTKRNRVPRARRPRPRALPDARMRGRDVAPLGRTAGQPQRLEGRALQRSRPPSPSRKARLHPRGDRLRDGTRSEAAVRTLFGCPTLRTLFGCMGLFSRFWRSVPFVRWRRPISTRLIPSALCRGSMPDAPPRVSHGPSGQARGKRGEGTGAILPHTPPSSPR